MGDLQAEAPGAPKSRLPRESLGGDARNLRVDVPVCSPIIIFRKLYSYIA